MSFWRLTKSLAPAPTDGIAGILAPLTLLDPPPSDSSSSPPSPLSAADLAAHRAALDALLDEPDLLSEIKTGENRRLTDFLARREVVLRLGGWVVWGLGRGILDADARQDGQESEEADALGSGLLPDGLDEGKVPDEVLQAVERERTGMGGVPRPREIGEDGRYVEGQPDEETEQEKKWAIYPRLCTEILVSNSPSLAETLFRHDAASSQPDTCPAPESFLLPFWESILGSTELQLASRAQQVGFWAKVNSFLLDSPMGSEVLAQILQIPHLPPRLLALLPFCSPINDLLLLLLRVSRPPSPLIPSTVTQTMRMLDPFSALGKPGHVAAEELLRGIIEVCLAIPRSQGGVPGPGGLGGPGANASPVGPGDEPILEWRDTTLARQIADEKSVRTLLDWMLAELDEEGEDGTEDERENSQEQLKKSQAGEEGGESTPQPASPATPAPANGPFPSPPEDLPIDDTASKRDLRTSSLIASIAVLIDLIRKNNSDFVEQHMLAWARRKEAAQAEREMLEEEGAEVLPLPGAESADISADGDLGPSVIDLGGMLSLVAEHIECFQRLIRKPRSSTAPAPTVSGKHRPLTLERFRICEFYAELLHCSNMSLVNRPDRSAHLYSSTGHLLRGWRAADDLALALAGPPPQDEEIDLSPTPYSPDLAATKSAFSTSPGGEVVSSFSSVSTPSGDTTPPANDGEVREAASASSAPAIEESKGDGAEEVEDTDEENVADTEEAAKAEEEEDRPSHSTPDDLKRFSLASNGTVSTIERDLPATPSIYSVASRQLPSLPLPPGPLLKTKFIEHGVVSTMLDLFFDHPSHNFLHNVVFDVLQQIFHGRLDRPLDRQLAVSTFVDGRLCERILKAQKRNDEAAAARTNMRLGYMGHVTLIAEETVKLFERYPELRAMVEPSIPQPAWNTYAATTLRETRERDMTPLDGASAALNLSLNKAPSSASLSDDDDEFPLNTARAMRATEAAGMAGRGAAVDAGQFGGHGKPGGLDMGEHGGLSDPFSKYLADALSSDRNVGSSDEDEEDETWLGGSRFISGSGDGDFEFAAHGRLGEQSGLDDRFGESTTSAFGSAVSGDDEWSAFGSSSTPAADAFGSDNFTSASSAANDFPTSFSSSFDSDFAPSATGAGEDDFGDFEGGESGFGSGPSITLPPMDSFDDFDFSEEGRATSSAFEARPVFARAETEEDDGSSRFGRLSLAGESEPGSPAEGVSPLPPLDVALANEVAGPGSVAADAATSPTEPLGPSVHEGAHLAADGFVEAEVEGQTVRVPADDIVVSHRRNPLESSRRPSTEGQAKEE
ncbi:hypothetical protein JCM10213_005548 [Rhodosporidiobolus nylandii]